MSVLFAALAATCQVQTEGTIVFINSSQTEIVFAADSRSAGDSSYTDKDCKISAFGNKVIFAASGRGGVRNKITHSYVWNAQTLARDEFRRITRKGTPQRLAEQLASRWGIAMKKQLEKDIARDRDYTLSGIEGGRVLALGVFAAFERDGTFLIVVERVVYEINRDGSVIVKTLVDHRATGPGAYYLGKGEIVREYIAGQTARSKEWKRDMERGVEFSSDPTVFLAKNLVRLTIDNYPPTRTDSEGNRFSVVGGPIAVARLTAEGVQWPDPGNCRAK